MSDALFGRDLGGCTGISTQSSPVPSPGSMLPCLYCYDPIPASSFAYWSGAHRLLSAECPSCERRVTLTAATWRHWSDNPLSVAHLDGAGVSPSTHLPHPRTHRESP
jgi:hypothetical protein